MHKKILNVTHCILFNTQFNAKVHIDVLFLNSENWQTGESQQFYPKDYERFKRSKLTSWRKLI